MTTSDAFNSVSGGTSLREAIEAGCIVPDCTPELALAVSSVFELGEAEIECGETLKPSECQGPLRFAIDPEGRAGRSALFTVVCVDPDPPFDLGPIVHYAAVNVPSRGGELGAAGMGAAAVLQPWKPPGPPANTGLHRYVFLVFPQGSLVNPAMAEINLARTACDLETFQDMFGLGPAASVVYFSSRFECGCNFSTLLSLLCCAFCCWKSPPDDYRERPRLGEAAKARPAAPI
jgi:phosphatidylethanolamine-binding protein